MHQAKKILGNWGAAPLLPSLDCPNRQAVFQHALVLRAGYYQSQEQMHKSSHCFFSSCRVENGNFQRLDSMNFNIPIPRDAPATC